MNKVLRKIPKEVMERIEKFNSLERELIDIKFLYDGKIALGMYERLNLSSEGLEQAKQAVDKKIYWIQQVLPILDKLNARQKKIIKIEHGSEEARARKHLMTTGLTGNNLEKAVKALHETIANLNERLANPVVQLPDTVIVTTKTGVVVIDGMVVHDYLPSGVTAPKPKTLRAKPGAQPGPKAKDIKANRDKAVRQGQLVLEYGGELIDKVIKKMVGNMVKELHQVTPNDILKQVAIFYAISTKELIHKNNNTLASESRRVTAYLVRIVREAELYDIGALLGGRSHLSVTNQINYVDSEIRKNITTKLKVTKLLQILFTK